MANGNDMAFPCLGEAFTPNGSIQTGLTKREWMATTIVAAQVGRISLADAIGLTDELLSRLSVRHNPRNMTEELWCVHAIGPDDLYAAPNKAVAQEAVEHLTKYFSQFNHPLDPKVSFAVEPWPYSPESHTKHGKRFYEEVGLAVPEVDLFDGGVEHT